MVNKLLSLSKDKYGVEFQKGNSYTKEQKMEWLTKRADEERSNPGKGENTFKKFLDVADIKYTHQYPVIIDLPDGGHKGYILDFYLPEYGCGVEINYEGHTTEKEIQKDNERCYNLYKHGIPIICIWQWDLKKLKGKDLKEFLSLNIEAIHRSYNLPELDYNEFQEIRKKIVGKWKLNGEAVLVSVYISGASSLWREETIFP